MAMEDCVQFLKKGGGIAILDGTNSTVSRRQMVYDFLKQQKTVSLKVVFVEVICNDQVRIFLSVFFLSFFLSFFKISPPLQSVIRENVINAKLSNPDYATIADKEKVYFFSFSISLPLSQPHLLLLFSQKKVLKDFMERVHEYEKTYEPLGTHREDRSYIKIIDVNRQLAINRVYAFILILILGPKAILLFFSFFNFISTDMGM